jgi:4-(2-carboxyphenyl)-2-oxobut-3-enoate aldolase
MAATPKITAADLSGVLGYLLTPTKGPADNSSRNWINLDETARAAESLIEDGVSALCLNGTFGEVASLTWEEIEAFTRTVVETARGKVPVFAGATTLNTRDTIQRAKAFREIGADGLMLGRPMMSPMSDNNTIQFYTEVADEVPDLAIVIYDDAEAFRRPITTQMYGVISRLPQVVAAKYRTRLLISGLVDSFLSDLDAVGDRMKLLPGEFDWYVAYRHFGVTTCWSSLVCGGPAPVMALRDALYGEHWQLAQQLTKEIGRCYEGIVPAGNFEAWHLDKVPFMKARFAAAGYLDPGPPLPPYKELRPERRAIAEECGRRSRELQERYSARPVAAE